MAELKDRIREKKQHTLASYEADTLTLYQVNIDISSDEAFEQVTGKVSQNRTYTQDIQNLSTEPKRVLTNPSKDLSEYWGEDLPKKTIHILVELPPGDSIDSMDPRVQCVADTSPISSATPPRGPRGVSGICKYLYCVLILRFQVKQAASTEEPDSPSKRLRAGLLSTAIA